MEASKMSQLYAGDMSNISWIDVYVMIDAAGRAWFDLEDNKCTGRNTYSSMFPFSMTVDNSL